MMKHRRNTIMKKLLSLFLTFCLIGSLGMSTISADAAKMKLNKTRLTLSAGSSYILKVKKASGKVKWKSNRKSVATVSSKGKVTAKKPGSATITARVGKKKYTCKVKVKPDSKGTMQNPKSAYSSNTVTYYQEGKKIGKFTLTLLQFESGETAAAMVKNNAANPVPGEDQEYIYFKFQIQYLSGNQTVNARDIFYYYSNIYGASSIGASSMIPLKNLDWAFSFEAVDDLGVITLSPGNKVTCSKAILVSKGYTPVMYSIPTGKDSFTWFTTAR